MKLLLASLLAIHEATGQCKVPGMGSAMSSALPSSDDELISFIVGGESMAPREFPFLVSAHGNDNYHSCGGTLIAKRFVLTAAHCVDPGLSIKYVEVGAHNLEKAYNDEDECAQKIYVKNWIVHPNYNMETFNNDIMILELKQDAWYEPAAPYFGGSNIADSNKDLQIAGWGSTKGYDAEDYETAPWNNPKRPKKATIPVIDRRTCRERYAQNDGWDWKITKKMMCASKPGVDSCQGDSGGPLFHVENNKAQVVGVVSSGYGCADRDHYGIYTRVEKFKTWICENTNNKPSSC